jgi:ATP-dependent helicase/nuclease subunit B
VFLTRSQKIDGVPTVPSRWLMRLQALLAGMGLEDAMTPEAPWLGWARARDAYGDRVRIEAPEPRPAVELRPRRLSVTRIETWLANPYAIFAKDILKLDRLPELGADPDPALRGSIVHEIVGTFAARYPQELPGDAKSALISIAREVLSRYDAHPRVAAFWGPRFARFAEWFAETEPARRKDISRVLAEVEGALPIPAPGGTFMLTARADRIDLAADGIVITDYKTGQVPADKAVNDGLSPQLPLEAAIARGETGFANVASHAVKALRYIRTSGGEPPGEERDVKTGDIAALADMAGERLARLVAQYDDAATPYRALRRARFSYGYDDFAHLARVAEWSVPTEEDPA